MALQSDMKIMTLKIRTRHRLVWAGRLFKTMGS